LLDKFSESFSLDHLLVQDPKPNDDNFKYYCDDNGGMPVLALKDGHDFPDNIKDGMPYDAFKRIVLNKLGNLRIYYRDKNSGRQNSAIELGEFAEFHTYKDIIEREKTLISKLVKTILKSKESDIVITKNKRKVINKYASVQEIIDAGYLKIGDLVYISLKPKTSIAKLIDTNLVEYNGENMTLNQWGCLVTGWSSISVYRYCSKIGETKTLQDIREEMLNKNL
jgi:hypothetical protein